MRLCLCSDPEHFHDMTGARWQECQRPGCGCVAYRTDSRAPAVSGPEDPLMAAAEPWRGAMTAAGVLAMGRTWMGWELVCEALDEAPDSLSWRERCALVVLAAAADDSTRDCPPGIEDQPDIIRQLRLSRTQRFVVISALVDKGALTRIARGHNGVLAAYSIAVPGPGQDPVRRDATRLDTVVETVDNPVNGDVKHPGFRDATPLKGPGLRDATDPAKHPGFRDATGLLDPGFRDATTSDTVPSRSLKDDDDDLISRAHARTREAVRAAVPGVTDDEIDETIRIVKHRYNVRNIEVYVGRMIKTGTLEEHIPCGLGGKRHSASCRNRDCGKCTAPWCEGRCHGTRTAIEPGEVRSA